MTAAYVIVDALTSLKMVTNIGFHQDFALLANGTIQKHANLQNGGSLCSLATLSRCRKVPGITKAIVSRKVCSLLIYCSFLNE